MDSEYSFKICLCGDRNVGKSCLIKQYFDKTFQEQTPTIGIESQTKDINIDGVTVKTMIWDTSGDERYKVVFPHYFKGAHGVILAYDITSLASFQKMEEYYSEIKKICGENIVTLLCGTKCDKEGNREVSISKAEHFANEKRIAFMETSAKSATNVQEAFMTIAKGTKLNRNKEANSNRHA
jgi:Ras-related protein Rab-1A